MGWVVPPLNNTHSLVGVHSVTGTKFSAVSKTVPPASLTINRYQALTGLAVVQVKTPS